MRKISKQIVSSSSFNDLIFFCVLSNTIILILDGAVSVEFAFQYFSKFNLFFTIIYSIELSLKLFGFGFKSK